MDLSLKIDVVKNIAKEEFKKNYLIPQKPVVLKGIADNTSAGKKWCINYFKETMGNTIVDVFDNNNSKNVLLAKLIHCYPLVGPDAGQQKVDPGVMIDESVGKSHFSWNDKGYYTHACLPKNWLV